MKKILSIFILIISITLIGCSSEKHITYVFDKNNPTSIPIQLNGEIKNLTVEGEDITLTLSKEKLTDFLDNDLLVLDYYFFYNFKEGTYNFTLETNEKIKFIVKLSGTLYEFDYISKKDVFSIESEKYFILFSKDNCSACEKLSLELKTFNEFLKSYPTDSLPLLYIVNCTNEEASIGESTSLIGINSYESLINDVELSTPTLVAIEKGTITNYYIGYSNISSFLEIETENISKYNILHNIDDPKVITIPLDFVPTKYSLTTSAGKKISYSIPTEYTEGQTGYNNDSLIFSIYNFNSKLPGTYKLRIYNTEDSFEATLYITSIFNYISIKDLFNMPDSKYYVFFLRDGCSGCNYAKPTLLEYTKNYASYSSNLNYPLYAVHRSQHSADIYSSTDNLIGVSSLDDFKISAFPRVILIENGIITEVYTNKLEPFIVEYFSSISK